MADEFSAEERGQALVLAVARIGEIKGRLLIALDALHTAMAITPLGMDHVTALGDLANGVAAQLSEHDEALKEFAQKVTVEARQEGAA